MLFARIINVIASIRTFILSCLPLQVKEITPLTQCKSFALHTNSLYKLLYYQYMLLKVKVGAVLPITSTVAWSKLWFILLPGSCHETGLGPFCLWIFLILQFQSAECRGIWSDAYFIGYHDKECAFQMTKITQKKDVPLIEWRKPSVFRAFFRAFITLIDRRYIVIRYVV